MVKFYCFFSYHLDAYSFFFIIFLFISTPSSSPFFLLQSTGKSLDESNELIKSMEATKREETKEWEDTVHELRQIQSRKESEARAAEHQHTTEVETLKSDLER